MFWGILNYSIQDKEWVASGSLTTKKKALQQMGLFEFWR